MLRKIARSISGLAILASSLNAFGITLTPDTNGGTGEIPAYCGTTDFVVGTFDFIDAVILPESTCSGAVINVRNNADATELLIALANTDMPLLTIFAGPGGVMSFKFDAPSQKWRLKLPDLSPNTVGPNIPANSAVVSRYEIWDGNWAPTITLPPTAAPGAIMMVRSDATWGAQIAPTNVLHASSMSLAKGEEYQFTFHPVLKKWYIMTSPVSKVNPQQAASGSLSRTVRPRSELELPASMQSASIKLPTAAGDRDRFRVTSLSAATNTILNAGIDFAGTLNVRKGDVYDFMWVAEKARWVVMSSPARSYRVNNIQDGKISAMSSPTAKVYAEDGSWHPKLELPAGAKTGDRVLVTSTATWSFRVVSEASPANFSAHTVSTGDTVAFIVNKAGQWTVETPNRVDVLNIYANTVVSTYGPQAARARQLESLRQTNEALENSRANFRVKMVGLLQVPDQGSTLHEALNLVRTDAVIQSERARVKADTIYYEGPHSGQECGLGWFNPNPNNLVNMVGSGRMTCPPTIMRHELAHNMGVDDAGPDATGGSAPYARGYSLVDSIMASNIYPYYSTPLVYHDKLGIPLGIENEIDATRALNNVSKQVSELAR